MDSLIKAIDNLPKIVKLIFCIPAIAIIWMIYRLCRSLAKKNIVGIVLAIVLLFAIVLLCFSAAFPLPMISAPTARQSIRK